MKNPKDPNRRKKRPYRPKSKRVAAKKGQEDDSKSEPPDPGSEGSSPADAATDADLDGNEDTLPKFQARDGNQELPRPQIERATSAEPILAGKGSMRAPEPLIRAVRSSPIKHDGSRPRHGNGLTPKPVRRQLFPLSGQKPSPGCQASPGRGRGSMTGGPLLELPNVCRRSPRLNKTVDIFTTNPETPAATGKENRSTGSSSQDRGLDDLFGYDDDNNLPAPPSTPTPSRRSNRNLNLLKTPTAKTPTRRLLGSPTNRQTPQTRRSMQKIRTPVRNLDFEQMTPLSRIMHDMTAQELAARSTPSSLTHALSPRSRQVLSLGDMDFSTLDPDFFCAEYYADLEVGGDEAQITAPPASTTAAPPPLDGLYDFLDDDGDGGFFDPFAIDDGAPAGAGGDGGGGGEAEEEAKEEEEKTQAYHCWEDVTTVRMTATGNKDKLTHTHDHNLDSLSVPLQQQQQQQQNKTAATASLLRRSPRKNRRPG
jgi:hypothetical protein